MTDNEKRAHDLALTYLTVTDVKDAEFYKLYVDMYQSFLSRIEEDFRK